MRRVRVNQGGTAEAREPQENADSPENAVSTGAADGGGPSAGSGNGAAGGGASGSGSQNGAPDGRVAELEKRLEEKDQEAKENYDRYLRAVADLQNVRNRHRQEREQEQNAANVNLILQFLPILDNFELALQHSESNRDFDVLLKGVQQILKQMQDTLRKQGVEPIEAVGKTFDPAEHEAVGHAPSNDYPENTVVQDLRTGYRMNGRCIRPSIVRVAGG